MIGESLFKSLILWLPRKYFPARLRHRLGIYTFSEMFYMAVGRGMSRGLRESGLFDKTEQK